MFSYFANHSQNTPIGSLTLQELHRQLVNPDREPFTGTVNLIKRLRAATEEAEQKRIKGILPSFTPGGMVDTREKDAPPEQKNIRLSGFMQVDLDLQDNPNMKDPAAVRALLAKVPYIALAAISARGKGVWGLVALAEPDKFMKYVNQVNDYFKNARVTLDKSKGKNPTELRYFAPDPGAILKEKYELMPLVPPAPVKPIAPRQQQPTGSTFAELQRWVTDTTGFNLVDGQKHYYLFWLSYALRKNDNSEPDVYSAIYSLVPENEIHSNCISGGITHANNKGIYTPQQRTTAPQTQVKQITRPQAETLTDAAVWAVIERQYKAGLFDGDVFLNLHETSDHIKYDLIVLSADCLINYGLDVTPEKYYQALRWRESAVNNSKNTAI
ncbi:MAG: hypothetical protein V1775_00205 [Bacteroidota bacterium]